MKHLPARPALPGLTPTRTPWPEHGTSPAPGVCGIVAGYISTDTVVLLPHCTRQTPDNPTESRTTLQPSPREADTSHRLSLPSYLSEETARKTTTLEDFWSEVKEVKRLEERENERIPSDNRLDHHFFSSPSLYR